MTLEEWHDPLAQCFGLMLNGKAGDYRTPDGRSADDDVLLIVMNAHHDMVRFTLPQIAGGVGWRRCLDTTEPEMADDAVVHALGHVSPVPARSLVLFICHPA
jgi:glycogen operon protein